MRQRLALGAAFALALGLTGVAWAQSGAGSPATGQGASGPPGASTGGDPSKPPTSGGEKGPKSAFPAPASVGRPVETGKPGPTGTAGAAASPGAGSFRGHHRISGEVLKIDQGRGWVTLRTDMGDMDLHFPPGSLLGIKEGDRVEVQLGLRPSGTGSAHSQKSP